MLIKLFPLLFASNKSLLNFQLVIVIFISSHQNYTTQFSILELTKNVHNLFFLLLLLLHYYFTTIIIPILFFLPSFLITLAIQQRISLYLFLKIALLIIKWSLLHLFFFLLDSPIIILLIRQCLGLMCQFTINLN